MDIYTKDIFSYPLFCTCEEDAESVCGACMVDEILLEVLIDDAEEFLGAYIDGRYFGIVTMKDGAPWYRWGCADMHFSTDSQYDIGEKMVEMPSLIRDVGIPWWEDAHEPQGTTSPTT